MLLVIGTVLAFCTATRGIEKSASDDPIRLPSFPVNESRSEQFIIRIKSAEDPKSIKFIGCDGYSNASQFPEGARYRGRGLRSGDEIFSVEGKFVAQVGAKEAHRLFRLSIGKTGTAVVEVCAEGSKKCARSPLSECVIPESSPWSKSPIQIHLARSTTIRNATANPAASGSSIFLITTGTATPASEQEKITTAATGETVRP